MKGLSVVASILLFALAHYLPAGLRRAGALPAKHPSASFLPGSSEAAAAHAKAQRVYSL